MRLALNPARQLLSACRSADAAARFAYHVRRQAGYCTTICGYGAYVAFRAELHRATVLQRGKAWVFTLSLLGMVAHALYLAFTAAR